MEVQGTSEDLDVVRTGANNRKIAHKFPFWNLGCQVHSYQKRPLTRISDQTGEVETLCLNKGMRENVDSEKDIQHKS